VYTEPSALRTEVQIIVEPMGKVDVGVYAGNGGFASGVTAASLAFSAAGLSIRPITAEDLNEGRLKKQARALYMPGGWAEAYVTDIDAEGAASVMKFVEDGGGYVGICAGSFYAAAEIHWAGESLPYDLDLFPGTPTGPLVEIAPWPQYVTTGITLDNTHVIAAGIPKTLTVLYYGGPAFRTREGAQVDVVARFDANGEPAVVAFEHGKGRVFLSSVHLEYDLTSAADGTEWPEMERGLNDPESDWPLLQSAARWLLKREK
jgi:glutamine amidotransferase-like uncharacterized protein